MKSKLICHLCKMVVVIVNYHQRGSHFYSMERSLQVVTHKEVHNARLYKRSEKGRWESQLKKGNQRRSTLHVDVKRVIVECHVRIKWSEVDDCSRTKWKVSLSKDMTRTRIRGVFLLNKVSSQVWKEWHSIALSMA